MQRLLVTSDHSLSSMLHYASLITSSSSIEIDLRLPQGLPPPKELTLQSCLLDRASMLMLQVVLPYALHLDFEVVMFMMLKAGLLVKEQDYGPMVFANSGLILVDLGVHKSTWAFSR